MVTIKSPRAGKEKLFQQGGEGKDEEGANLYKDLPAYSGMTRSVITGVQFRIKNQQLCESTQSSLCILCVQ